MFWYALMIGSSAKDVERHRPVIGVDHSLDRIAQVVAPVETGQRAMIGLAVRIVLGAGVAIDDVGVMVAVGDDVRIAIKDQKRRQPLDPFDNIATDQDPALLGKVSGNEQP